MVKNTIGGNKGKKHGRKYLNESNTIFKTRYSSDPDEVYGCCSKMLGNGMCEVRCIDSIERLCIIRKKFKGRGKRDNIITIGTWVLVGVRTFEKLLNGKKQRCDLLEVYNTENQKKIKQKEIQYQDKWYILDSILDNKFNSNNNKNDENFTFEDNNNFDYESQKFIVSESEEEDDSDENKDWLHSEEDNEDSQQNTHRINLLNQEKEEITIDDI